jgi:peptidoglycan/xylan/chitin deacetylase (PgdA/CDA1 family)
MVRLNKDMVAATLRLAHTVHFHRLFGDAVAGRGVIFMLHKVSAHAPGSMAFPANEDLFVTPEFLAETIERVRQLDYDIVSIDEAIARLGDSSARRFAVFTLDDAYRDTLKVAYPVFSAASAPFTVYVPTAWADGRGLVKWAVLEGLVSAGSAVQPALAGLPALLPTGTRKDRQATIGTIDRYLARLDGIKAEIALGSLAENHGVDVEGLCREQIMSWDEIRRLAGDGLVTIGAHSIDHFALSGLCRDELARQVAGSKARVEEEIGRPCRHFSYPFGNSDAVGPREIAQAAAAGFSTAVTTRRGVVFDHHRVRPLALPRIALAGRMEDLRCMEMLISGVPDMVLNRFRSKVV